MGISHTKRKFISCNNSCLKFFEDQVNLRLVINEYFKIRTCTISWKQRYQNTREIDHIIFQTYPNIAPLLKSNISTIEIYNKMST